MKYTVYLAAVFLVSLGLAAPAPVHDGKSIHPSDDPIVPFSGVEFDGGLLEKRKKTGGSQGSTSKSAPIAPPKAKTSTKARAPTGPSKSKPAAPTQSKSKPSKTSKAIAASHATHSVAASSHVSTEPSACTHTAKSTGKNGKVGTRNTCQEREQYIDFGNGWRTPTKAEQRAAKVKTPYAKGAAPADVNKFRTMDDDFPKPDPPDRKSPNRQCPSTGRAIVNKNRLDMPRANGSLFYSAVGGTEVTWATGAARGFQMVLELVKVDQIIWVQYSMNCKRYWHYMSQAAALVAKGDVHVLVSERHFEVGQKPVWQPNRSGNPAVWQVDEFPTLVKQNQEACRIWRWITAGATEPDLIAIRTGSKCAQKYPAVPAGAAKKTYDWANDKLV